MSACCKGRGMVRIRFEGGEPDHFAVCACAAGQHMREDRNTGHTVWPHWRIRLFEWGLTTEEEQDACAGMIEQYIDRETFLAAFPGAPWPWDEQAPDASQVDLAAAMRTGERRRG